MLNVTVRELEKAYLRHRGCSGAGALHPHFLLLVCCVECGLKALLMRYNRVDRYHDLPRDAQVGHDLNAALVLLRAPANLSIRQAKTVHGRLPQQSVTPKELHEAFRYGIPIQPEQEIVQHLQKVVTWIGEYLS
jgi:hypothetical protein